MKYAFTISKQGEVKISLSKDDQSNVLLMISDNGKGFPKDVDFRDTESLGMQLVVSLIEQIDGTIELDHSNGAKYEIRFKSIINKIN